METVSEAIGRLEAAGFRDSFRATEGRLWALAAERFFDPERLVVNEIVRFEGESDPDDMAILFALRSASGDVRGTFTTAYGAMVADPDAAEVLARLAGAERERRPRVRAMETLSEAIARLEAAGFRDSFRADGARLWALAAQRFFAPDALVVEEVVRFEGESDPDEQAILFALRSPAGDVRGTFATPYGPLADATSADVVRRLVRVG